MEKDCFVTQFNADTNDNSLQVYGAIEFSIADGNSSVRFSFGDTPEPLTVTLIGDGDLKDGNGNSFGKSYTHNGGAWNGPTLATGSANSKIIVTNMKYTFDYIKLIGAKIDPDMLALNSQPVRDRHSLILDGCLFTSPIDVSKLLSYTTVVSIDNTVGGNVKGKFTDLSALRYTANKTSEPIINATSLIGKGHIIQIAAPVAGDFKYLADTGIVNGNGTNYLHGAGDHKNTWTTGSIEEFVSRAIANGKTTGSVKLEYVRSFHNLYYQGISLSEHTELPQASNTKFSWNAQGAITWS